MPEELPNPIPQGAESTSKIKSYPQLWLGGETQDEQLGAITNYLEAIGFYSKAEPGITEDLSEALYPAHAYTPKGEPVPGLPATLTFEQQMRFGTMSDLSAAAYALLFPLLKLKEGYDIGKASSINQAKEIINEASGRAYARGFGKFASYTVDQLNDIVKLGKYSDKYKEFLLDQSLNSYRNEIIDTNDLADIMTKAETAWA